MKSERQQAILNIIAQREIETQEQLLEALKAAGIDATQATISRDIKQLRLVKELSSTGGYKYTAVQHRTDPGVEGRLRTIFRESVTSFDLAQNIVVLKTLPGLANAAAAALDSMDLPELVGTLAGDDTAILIMRTNASAQAFCDEAHTLLL